MNKLYFLLIVFTVLTASASAQKILMKIAAVTAAAGEEVRALEFQINANSSWTGGGASVGKPAPGNLMIKRTNNKSTAELFRSIGG